MPAADHVENLRPGNFIAVIASNEPEPTSWRGKQPTGGMCGVPVEILAISPPFLAVRTPGDKIQTIDVRAWQVRKVSKRYANLFFETEHDQGDSRPDSERETSGRLCYCACCGDKLVEVLQKGGDWIKTCRQCGQQFKECKA